MHNTIWHHAFEALKQVAWCLSLFAALNLVACDGDSANVLDSEIDAGAMDSALDAQPAECDNPVQLRYETPDFNELTTYPSDRYTREDGESLTGLSLDFDETLHPWFDNLPRLLLPERSDVESFSGFAQNGSVILRFDGPLPDGLPWEESSLSSDALVWLDLDASPITRIPYSSTKTLDESGIILDPLTTLKPGHRHAVIALKSLWTNDVCFQQNATFTGLLTAPESGTFGENRLAKGLLEALEHLSVDPSELVGGTSFTTHMDHLKLKAVADEVLTRNYTWLPQVDCEDTENYTVCEASFKAWDFRDPKMIKTVESSRQWTLPVRIFLPLERNEPLPVLLYGHGLNSGRTEADRFAFEFADGGFAVVAVDSLMHGDHPTRLPDSNLPALDFLGVKIGEAKVDGAAMHGNFTQTVVDRLQLLQLIRRYPDFDGDGQIDFDTNRIGYFGVSLGGMLGSLLLANAHSIPTAVLSISGGRLIQFLSDIPQLDTFRPAIYTLAGGDIKAERVLVFAQTIIDAADPATFGQFVMKDRLYPDTAPPHLLMPVADQDDTVPPKTGYALARSLGIPHVGPEITPVFGLAKQGTPISGNTLAGVTAGYFQFDRITKNDGRDLEAATHAELPPSPEALHQTRHFLTDWIEGRVPEIIDPYAELGTPALP